MMSDREVGETEKIKLGARKRKREIRTSEREKGRKERIQKARITEC